MKTHSIYGLLSIFLIANCNSFATAVHRKTRGVPLIFPQTSPTRTQWIIGIGIPLEDLLFEAMTTGYVWKAEYWLPYKAEMLRIKTQMKINPRNSRNGFLDNEHSFHVPSSVNETFPNYLDTSKRVLSSYRWAIYKSLEGLANNMGFEGRVCVLRSICEAAEVPFHYQNGVLADLMHILLTPSSSADELSTHSDNEYFQAESIGRSGVGCDRIYSACKRSLLDQLTNVHTLVENMRHVIG